MNRVDEILEFWFADGNDTAVWFAVNAAFDQACTGFLADYRQAVAGGLDAWQDAPRSALALILLLDQFPRNMFRGTPSAFASDGKGREVARQTLARHFDAALSATERSFVYLPFEHSESLDDQLESVRLFRKLADEVPATLGHLRYAEEHLSVIRRFGRFPQRNRILGRVSTGEEAAFLASTQAGG